MSSKIKSLTLRPSAARGERQTYGEWLDQWLNVLCGEPQPFKAASMSGGPASFYVGQLPSRFRAAYEATAFHAHQFVVYSYDTPIAWRLSDGSWSVPDTKYSMTTSRHQSHLSHLLGRMNASVTAL